MPPFKRNKCKPKRERKPFMSDEEWEKEEEEDDEIEVMEMMDVLFLVLGIIGANIFYFLGGLFGLIARR